MRNNNCQQGKFPQDFEDLLWLTADPSNISQDQSWDLSQSEM